MRDQVRIDSRKMRVKEGAIFHREQCRRNLTFVLRDKQMGMRSQSAAESRQPCAVNQVFALPGTAAHRVAIETDEVVRMSPFVIARCGEPELPRLTNFLPQDLLIAPDLLTRIEAEIN